MTDFTGSQLEGYSRHIILPKIGIEGQEKNTYKGMTLSLTAQIIFQPIF